MVDASTVVALGAGAVPPRPRRGRPPASSRREIEDAALTLFLRDGFTATTLADLTAATGVSKTSFFRYFPSKAAVVWIPFEETTRDLRHRLDAAADDAAPTMDLVRGAVAGVLADATVEWELWVRRFRVMVSAEELQGGRAAIAAAWVQAVAGFVARRHGLDPAGVTALGAASAVQAGYETVLRSWLPLADPAARALPDVEEALADLCGVLQGWLERLDAERAG